MGGAEEKLISICWSGGKEGGSSQDGSMCRVLKPVGRANKSELHAHFSVLCLRLPTLTQTHTVAPTNISPPCQPKSLT